MSFTRSAAEKKTGGRGGNTAERQSGTANERIRYKEPGKRKYSRMICETASGRSDWRGVHSSSFSAPRCKSELGCRSELTGCLVKRHRDFARMHEKFRRRRVHRKQLLSFRGGAAEARSRTRRGEAKSDGRCAN